MALRERSEWRPAKPGSGLDEVDTYWAMVGWVRVNSQGNCRWAHASGIGARLDCRRTPASGTMRTVGASAILADAVLLLHGAFIAWVMFGGLAVLRRPVLAWLHLPALVWGVWISASGGICPLTPLEQRLRLAAGEAGWHGSFIEHYLTALIYPDGLTRGTQALLAALLLAGNAVVYAHAWRRHRARRGRVA
jgi:Protein of Unknown function (DUF2784)